MTAGSDYDGFTPQERVFPDSHLPAERMPPVMSGSADFWSELNWRRYRDYLAWIFGEKARTAEAPKAAPSPQTRGERAASWSRPAGWPGA